MSAEGSDSFDRFQRQRDLFDQAFGLPAAEREAFVRQRAGDDEELCDAVLRLLLHAQSSQKLQAVVGQGDGETAERASQAIEDLPVELELQLVSCVVTSGKLRRNRLRALFRQHAVWQPAIVAWLDAFSRRREGERFRRFGRYTVIREIGRGGMGVVHVAWDEDAQRWVALKRLRDGWQEEDSKKRFQREARVLAQLEHDSVVPVFETGQLEGTWFFAMELVHGISLRRLVDGLAQRRVPVERLGKDDIPNVVATFGRVAADAFQASYVHTVVDIVATVADALVVAHDHGVVHRDIKPENIMLRTDGRVRVLDFGLARVSTENSLTMSQDVVGTPSYLAPEQLRGSHGVDGRADVYSLGVTLFELLALQAPFRGRTIEEVYQAILFGEPESLARLNPALPRDLLAIVRKAMERELGDRYETAAQFRDDLDAFRNGAAVSVRSVGGLRRWLRRMQRHRLAIAVVTVIAAVAIGLLVVMADMLGALDARGVVDDLRAVAVMEAGDVVTWRRRVDALPDAERARAAALLDRHERSLQLLAELRVVADGDLGPEAWPATKQQDMLPGYLIEAQKLLGALDDNSLLQRLLALEQPLTVPQLAQLERQKKVLPEQLWGAFEQRMEQYRSVAQLLDEMQRSPAVERPQWQQWSRRVQAVPFGVYRQPAADLLSRHERGIRLLADVRALGVVTEADLAAFETRAELLLDAYRAPAKEHLETVRFGHLLLGRLEGMAQRTEAPSAADLESQRLRLARLTPAYRERCEQLLRKLELMRSAAGGADPRALAAAEPVVLATARPAADTQWVLLQGRRWPVAVVDGRTGVQFVLVPAADEAPPFYLARCELSWRQLGSWAEAPTPPADVDADLPATVNLLQARAWCENFGYHVPTEAEWSRAAKAAHGGGWLGGVMFGRPSIWCSAPGRSAPRPVAADAKDGSPSGPRDLLGNVWEWCEIERAPDPQGWQGPAAGAVRGGGYDTHESMCSVDARVVIAADRSAGNVGIRPILRP